jgi:hypothetical protein
MQSRDMTLCDNFKYKRESVNRSQMEVVDVIDFLCLSLGSSTVQLHCSQVRRHACHVQRLVSVVKMVIVLEECITEEQHCVVHFFMGKRSNAEDICK